MTASRFRLAIAIAIVATLASLLGVLLTVHHPTLGSTAAAAATTSPSPSGKANGPRGGHPGFDGGFPGGGTGTVTGISNGTITLRTLTGTLTVNTTDSTTYTKEGKSIHIGDIKDGDVLAVRSQRPSGTQSPSATPPTTVTATAITVVQPTFFGRVTSISGPTIFIVARDGQEEYVFTTNATTYTSSGSAAKFTDVKTGDYISAQGTQSDLKHLTADTVTISTNAGHAGGPGFPAPNFGGPRFPGRPHASGSPSPAASITQ